MTTAVEVRANHGWPVRVTLVVKPVGLAAPDPVPQSLIVPPGEVRTLYVHSHLDLIVHEIQPDEEGFTAAGPFGKTDKVEARIVQAVGRAEGVATTGEAEAEVVPRTVTGYIDPITADKIRL